MAASAERCSASFRHCSDRGANWQVEGFVDDSASEANLGLVADLGSGVLGPIPHLRELGDVNSVIGVGAPASRELIARYLAAYRSLGPFSYIRMPQWV